MRGLCDLRRLTGLIRRYRGLDPAQRTAARYAIVLVVICWANYSFVRFRIPLYAYSAFLPDAGVLLLYLWLILWLDELLALFQSGGLLAMLIGKVKRASLALVAVYASAALLLAVNGISTRSVTIRPAKIVATANPYRGSWNHGTVLVAEGDGAGDRREILLASRQEKALYAGEDVEVVLGRGALFLNRVLEVRRNLEKYYRHMLGAAPDSLIALKGLVYVYAGRGNFDEAQRWYIRLAEKGGDGEIGTQLAQRMIDARQYGRAATLLKDLIKEDRGYDNLYTLGYALAWAGEKQEAAIYLQEATELDPADYRAFYSLGYVYRDTRQFAKAKQVWTTVLKLIPHFPEVEANLREIERSL